MEAPVTVIHTPEETPEAAPNNESVTEPDAATNATATPDTLIENIPLTTSSLVAPSTLIPNLNQLATASVVEEEKPEYVTGESAEKVTQEMLVNRWRIYTEKVKKDGKINLFTLLNSGSPTLTNEHQIEFTLENKIQEELLLHERVDLLNFLRIDLNNFKLELHTRIAEQTELKRLYTANEKYQHMVEKNPVVDEFRKTFNLDLEL